MSTLASTLPHGGWPGFDSELVGPSARQSRKILTVFGTRPEVIKLAPVIRQLESRGRMFHTVNVTSAQHTDLLYPLTRLLGVRFDYDLRVMSPGQTPNQVCSRVLAALDSILNEERPDLILVQGDTTTALAGALAGFGRGVAVGHVEAGLRSHDARSPFPEEVNRRLITNLASYHFAATPSNRDTLLAEGVAPQNIFVTGNPVVDSLKAIIDETELAPATRDLLEATRGLRRIVLTTHRRESFGEVMSENLNVLRRFVELHEDVALIFPVHPNPAVVAAAENILSGHPRCHLARPLNYDQFVALLSEAWLIVSDSGGVQEEAPTLGKPLLILRENTERPEAVESGVARLVGGSPARLMSMLEEAHRAGSWAARVEQIENPFGRGDSGRRIAEIIAQELESTTAAPGLVLAI
ncbi:MAG TPA: UDP-N-acetylglucosamine 2-epimerase (non-hydrolyzing) [Pyrinomonadaceae bacterium]|nr:UDP-N-acetylglucosamine 2-epimerase (non-hydrolyzing) [Pyrinomonadaceae bacterium]